MQNHLHLLTLLMVITVSVGCEHKQPATPSGVSDPKPANGGIDDKTSIQPGLYSNGAEYERIIKILESANASISLDYHQGIEWYDRKSKTWRKLDKIEELEPLLNAVNQKTLVEVTTGKVAWDKYDEYIDVIIKYAKTSGYQTTVVTAASASETIVSKVVHHNN